MLTSALVSALVSGLVFLSGETLATWRKSRAAARKRKATLARKNVAVRIGTRRRVEMLMSETDRQHILDCVHDDR